MPLQVHTVEDTLIGVCQPSGYIHILDTLSRAYPKCEPLLYANHYQLGLLAHTSNTHTVYYAQLYHLSRRVVSLMRLHYRCIHAIGEQLLMGIPLKEKTLDSVSTL